MGQPMGGVRWVPIVYRRFYENERVQVLKLMSPAVVKNPLSPVEHPGGLGANCELFELGVDQFVVGTLSCEEEERGMLMGWP